MNILMITPFFPPHKGGVETAAFYTAKYLSELDHKVVILTSKYDLEKRDFYKIGKIFVYRFKSFNLPELKFFPQSSNLGIMIKALIKLPLIIKKHNIQIIHAQTHVFPISIFSYFLNQIIFKRPMFITIQGRMNIGIWAILENIFDKTMTKYGYRKLNKVICVSNSLKKRFLKLNLEKDRFITIPNGVDTSKFIYKENSKYLDKFLGNNTGIKKIIFVGRLDAQKGVEFLLKAIPKVINAYKNVHFFILGNGILEKELKILAKNLNILSHTTFLDMIPLEKMPTFYSSADIFVLPSIHEGFPLSIAEALSCGLVIVASQTEGIPEAIKENKNGFLVKPKDISQLSYKLIKALELNHNKVEEIRERNIKLAKERYSWENIIKKLNKIYIE